MSDITGTWYNELNSVMEVIAKDGKLTGRYKSAKGDAEDWYNLIGYHDPSTAVGSGNYGATLSFTVQWNNNSVKGNSHSNVIQNGQFFKFDDNSKYIRTMWLLSSGSKPADEWRSVQAGLDKFKPHKRTPEEIEKKLAMLAEMGHAHPL